ncbi:hypothetical protein ACWEVD_17830 [Nocardia thailandica]|uniref:DUF4397 domain-containing protein n=1 Tax=Nocardia thailandica TaxID=257275 RepID=A0ABW6PGT3_9NOCA|nr:hypothetical protein [Nocardia thailandica]
MSGPRGAAGEPAPPGLTVDASYFPLAFMLALVKPKIFLNGQPVPHAQWGPTHIPVGPGQYHVRVVTPWLIDMGPAQTQVVVTDGPGARVYYRSPAAMFFNGAIGPVPQKTPGMPLMIALMALPLVIVLLSIVLAVAGSM